MERDAFLSRVSQATLQTVLPDPPKVPADLPQLEPADLLNLFRSNAQTVNTVVHGPVARHGVPRSIVGIAGGHDATKFMAWDDLPASGVAAALAADGMERVEHQVPVDGRLAHNATYIDVDVGVTGATAGLAESGSLILEHGPGRPRMASLIPEIHIALLEVSRLARTISQWAHENPESATETANLVFVTGPSRTGDIEQNLNLGVHGPRHVHVVLVK